MPDPNDTSSDPLAARAREHSETAAPKRVEFRAADYSLGSPEFATPALTPSVTPLRAESYTLASPEFSAPVLTPLVTPLRAQNYALAPLEFAAPAWCLIMGRAHVTVIWDPIGRPPGHPGERQGRNDFGAGGAATGPAKRARWKLAQSKGSGSYEVRARTCYEG
jgi:hypothetical protein